MIEPTAASAAFPPALAARSAPSSTSPDFADALARAAPRSDVTAIAPDMSPRQAAEELVATAFVKPVLASMRDMNQAAAPFAPTAAEKQFAPMLDAIFAQQIVRSGRFGLVEAVARQVQQRFSAAPASRAAVGAGAQAAEHSRHAPSHLLTDASPR